MQDPYEVLGVKPTDDDETIKKAYRQLVKKYHPDRYAGSPLHDQAQERLKAVNIAYDEIQRQRSGQGPTSHYGGGFYGGRAYTGSAPNRFAAVRNLIRRGYIAQALQILEGMSDRSAEWYYLHGVIDLRMGWYDRARQNIETACAMDGENPEYRQTLDQLSQGAQPQFRSGVNCPGILLCPCLGALGIGCLPRFCCC